MSIRQSGSVWVCLGLSGSVSHVRVVHVCVRPTPLPPPHAPPLSSPPLTLLTPLLKTLLAPWMAWMTVDDQRVARAVRRSFVNELHPDVLEPLVLVDARRPDLDERVNSPCVRFYPRTCLNGQRKRSAPTVAWSVQAQSPRRLGQMRQTRLSRSTSTGTGEHKAHPPSRAEYC